MSKVLVCVVASQLQAFWDQRNHQVHINQESDLLMGQKRLWWVTSAGESKAYKGTFGL